jgi:ferredoxin
MPGQGKPKKKTYRVTLVTNGRKRVISCPESEFILQAALDAGLDLPYMCLQGWCVTCAGKILSGTVDQSASFRFYEEDAREGFVLLCTARPTSDLRIKTHQKEAMREHRVRRKLPVPLS